MLFVYDPKRYCICVLRRGRVQSGIAQYNTILPKSSHQVFEEHGAETQTVRGYGRNWPSLCRSRDHPYFSPHSCCAELLSNGNSKSIGTFDIPTYIYTRNQICVCRLGVSRSTKAVIYYCDCCIGARDIEMKLSSSRRNHQQRKEHQDLDDNEGHEHFIQQGTT